MTGTNRVSGVLFVGVDESLEAGDIGAPMCNLCYVVMPRSLSCSASKF